MKDQTENDLKKNAATSASSAAGAIAGMVIGTVLSPQDIEAQDYEACETRYQEMVLNLKQKYML